MQLKLHNSLTKAREVFVPLDPTGKSVTFYSCGPTVYDFAHIGNFRSFLNADVLRRTLEFLGHDVRQVMNMTDVGHMTDDDVADGGGQDKMEVAAQRLAEAKKSGKLPPGAEVNPNDPYAIADFYIDAFLEDARTLGMKVVHDARDHPELMPRPTQYIKQMIELIEQLIANDHAYVGSDSVVYFDVQSFAAYGELSGNTPDRIRSGQGGRVDEATQKIKRHPADFMLWKPDARHLMRWPSPWGEGYPGWHIECSVMAMKLLGADSDGVIDIHSGGEDNIFPHHECEIAQTCGATGQRHFARYWFHTRFLIVEGEKMSKSKGNFFTVRDLMARGASPAAIRLELIKTHYRSQANFTFQGLKDSQRMIDRWARLHEWLEKFRDKPLRQSHQLADALYAFRHALCNDLNLSGAIATVNDAVNFLYRDFGGFIERGDFPPETSIDSSIAVTGKLEDELSALDQMNSVLGVLDLGNSAGGGIVTESSMQLAIRSMPNNPEDVTDEWVIKSIKYRRALREQKNWAAADVIRDELLDMGIAIKDGPEGTTWQRIVQ